MDHVDPTDTDENSNPGTGNAILPALLLCGAAGIAVSGKKKNR